MGRSPVPGEITDEVEVRIRGLGFERSRSLVQLKMLQHRRTRETALRGKLVMLKRNNSRLQLRSLNIG